MCMCMFKTSSLCMISLSRSFYTSTEGGFCSYDEVGLYMWPETRGGISVSLPCQLDSTIEVTRDCLNGGVWDEPADAVCSLLVRQSM